MSYKSPRYLSLIATSLTNTQKMGTFCVCQPGLFKDCNQLFAKMWSQRLYDATLESCDRWRKILQLKSCEKRRRITDRISSGVGYCIQPDPRKNTHFIGFLNLFRFSMNFDFDMRYWQAKLLLSCCRTVSLWSTPLSCCSTIMRPGETQPLSWRYRPCKANLAPLTRSIAWRHSNSSEFTLVQTTFPPVIGKTDCANHLLDRHIHVHTHIHTQNYIHVHTHTHIYLCVYINIYVYLHSWGYIYTLMIALESKGGAEAV